MAGDGVVAGRARGVRAGGVRLAASVEQRPARVLAGGDRRFCFRRRCRGGSCCSTGFSARKSGRSSRPWSSSRSSRRPRRAGGCSSRWRSGSCSSTARVYFAGVTLTRARLSVARRRGAPRGVGAHRDRGRGRFRRGRNDRAPVSRAAGGQPVGLVRFAWRGRPRPACRRSCSGRSPRCCVRWRHRTPART